MANMLANIFGSSPVRPLEKHIEIAFRCAKQLRPLFVAVIETTGTRPLRPAPKLRRWNTKPIISRKKFG